MLCYCIGKSILCDIVGTDSKWIGKAGVYSTAVFSNQRTFPKRVGEEGVAELANIKSRGPVPADNAICLEESEMKKNIVAGIHVMDSERRSNEVIAWEDDDSDLFRSGGTDC